jgi:iron complex transport system substrate-binding protein
VSGVRKGFLAAPLLVAALAASACGKRPEPTAASVKLFPVTVRDASGRTIEARRAPARIAAVTPGATELLASLGVGTRVVGIPAGARRGAAPHARLVVDRRGQIVAATFLRKRPDLVVGSTDVAPTAVRAQARRLHATLYVSPESSLRDVEKAATDLGLLTDEPIAARRVVSKLETARRRVAARVVRTSRVSVFVDTGFFTTVPSRSFVGDLIRLANGRNVAGPSPDPGPLDAHELLKLDPTVYIATSQSGTTLRSLRNDPVTSRLTAVRSGRFVTIDSALLQPGPRAAAGLVAIARALHPRAFR